VAGELNETGQGLLTARTPIQANIVRGIKIWFREHKMLVNIGDYRNLMFSAMPPSLSCN